MILDLYFLDCGLQMSFKNLILEAPAGVALIAKKQFIT
jgi:hypothetical protein